jgi:hypothetical protein
MIFSDLAVFEFIIRIIGRLGFMALLIGVYKLWHMPVLKKHADQFFWLAIVICFLSLAYTIIEFYLLGLSNTVSSIVFNVVLTWILAIYMNYRAYRITRLIGAGKIHEYSNEIDRKIAELKESSTSK